MDFEELNEYLHKYFHKHFRGQGLQEADIDDIVQTALLKAHRASDSFDPKKASLRTWVTTIAQRCLIDLYREKKPIQGQEDLFEGESREIVKDLQTDDLRYRIDLVLKMLSPKHQEIIRRRAFNAEPSHQIAKDEEVTDSTIRWRFHMACKEFRKLWEKYKETVPCQCGCGTWLPKYAANGKIRRFAHGHARRIAAQKRREKMIYCACGCGKQTSAIGKNGKPVRYLKNHYNKENRKYAGPTRNKRRSQSAVTKRAERKKKAEAAGLQVKLKIVKLCCHCKQEKLTKWSGHYNADLTPIYFSRCIECVKAYQRDYNRKRKAS